MAKLTNISILPSDDGYQLLLEDEGGETFDVFATYEQLDLLSEEIDQYLDEDEEDELSVDVEEGQQEPAEDSNNSSLPNTGSLGTCTGNEDRGYEDEAPSPGTDPLLDVS